ncbi:MAG: hypothetical protein ANABAC_0952 [Anaerolineae bacterium]|nr:MAG: hypothetical protein ANABAC_0952 [Anaerolineae bacterium]
MNGIYSPIHLPSQVSTRFSSTKQREKQASICRKVPSPWRRSLAENFARLEFHKNQPTCLEKVLMRIFCKAIIPS